MGGFVGDILGTSTPSTAGQAAAAKEATDLQRQIYEETVDRSQPFYNVGVSGVSRLAELLGLSGAYGASPTGMTQQQIIAELTPQFTTTGPSQQVQTGTTMQLGQGGSDSWESVPTYETVAGPSTLDQAGLDAAVAARMAQQQPTGGQQPEGFGSLLQTFGTEQFEADPGYAFRKAEGEKAMQRALAAQGKSLGGEYGKALTGYGQDLASQEYGRSFDRYRAGQSDIFNRLMGVTGIGTGQQAQLQQAGQTMAGNIGDTVTSLAQQQAAAQDAARARRSSLFSSGMQAGGAAMSDIRLKDNIKHVGEKNGHSIYHFKYKGDDTLYEGVMAQDVIKTNPEAVIVADNGFYAVKYDMIGVEMKEVKNG